MIYFCRVFIGRVKNSGAIMGDFSSDRNETADTVCGSKMIDQERIVASVKEKCELIKYLCSSNQLRILDRVKSNYHA